ncbi:MAG: hypothetical protein FWE48_05570 [Coriobacteriia bacterium]|nr:hypothetical protein [Coriobacteriia bacterium]MCL2746536.1 hypothetical protein [Coriobacteriia bacterium]MCL2870312.1 hypothetical protein [Coriobacteriia bacterium]
MKRKNKDMNKKDFLPSPTIKKFMMLGCLIVILLASALIIFYTQSAVSQMTLGSDQQKEQITHARKNDFSKEPTVTISERIGGQKDRIAAAKLERAAGVKLAEILPQVFGAESSIAGSIHYDLPTRSSFSNGYSEVQHIQDSDRSLDHTAPFPTEAYLKLTFREDQQLSELNLDIAQSFHTQLFEAGLINPKQKSSFLFVGPATERLFVCPGGNTGTSQLKEIIL